MREAELLYRYFLKFYFEGRDEPVIYEVDKATTERVKNNLEATQELFCCFSTQNGLDVAVNLGFIDLVHFLWELEAGTSLEEENVNDEDDWEIVIHFRNRKEPFRCGAAYPAEVSSLFDSLQLGSYNDDPFLWFTDEDDEVVILDGRKVLYIEAPSAMIMEGLEEIQKEEEEHSQSVEEPKARRTRESPIPINRRR